jgi:hypothetical protein
MEKSLHAEGWSSGKTAGSGPVNLGSNPSPSAILFIKSSSYMKKFISVTIGLAIK